MFRLSLLCFLLTGNGKGNGKAGGRAGAAQQLLESELVACGNIRSTCGLCHMKWIAMGLGWAALAAEISPTESGSSLPSPVWGLFLFLFRQHRRQHCYCLLMHYFALFSCGRQAAAASSSSSSSSEGRWRCPSLAVGVRSTHESLFSSQFVVS